MIKPARNLIRWWLLLTGYAGITLPPFGIYILAERMNDDALILHEQVHWQQAKRMGTFKFYAVYLWLLVKHGYQNHPMEIEARTTV